MGSNECTEKNLGLTHHPTIDINYALFFEVLHDAIVKDCQEVPISNAQELGRGKADDVVEHIKHDRDGRSA